MSAIPPRLSRQLRFYLSGPMPCPYLPDQVERKLFTRLNARPRCGLPVPEADARVGAPGAPDINTLLTRAGFRRSHDILYRPACPSCAACVPVRVPVRRFVPDAGLRRIARHNADLVVDMPPARAEPEAFALFRRYQQARHPDSDMAHMGAADFAAMMEEGGQESVMLCARDGSGALLGVMLADRLEDGFSAIYSFFAPEQERRSLGFWLILQLMDAARRAAADGEMPGFPGFPAPAGGPYVYLGYWIANSPKMSYKARLAPLEALGPAGWEERMGD